MKQEERKIMSNYSQRDSGRGESGRRAASWVFYGFLAIGAFFLLAEHRAHLTGWLPFLLLALCPLMHLFHGGHGGHGGRSSSADTTTRSSPLPPNHRH